MLDEPSNAQVFGFLFWALKERVDNIKEACQL